MNKYLPLPGIREVESDREVYSDDDEPIFDMDPLTPEQKINLNLLTALYTRRLLSWEANFIRD